MKIFDREPALIVNTVSALLSLIVTFNIGMSGEQAGAFVAVSSAVFGVIVAEANRPIAKSAFTAAVAAGAALLAAYGLDVSAETVGATNAAALAALALLTRGQVSPKGVAA
jgi:hypothetical protein